MTTTVKKNSEVVHSGTTISIDAMGGDLGPSVTVPAAITAMKDYGIKVILVGEEKEIKL